MPRGVFEAKLGLGSRAPRGIGGGCILNARSPYFLFGNFELQLVLDIPAVFGRYNMILVFRRKGLSIIGLLLKSRSLERYLLPRQSDICLIPGKWKQ